MPLDRAKAKRGLRCFAPIEAGRATVAKRILRQRFRRARRAQLFDRGNEMVYRGYARRRCGLIRSRAEAARHCRGATRVCVNGRNASGAVAANQAQAEAICGELSRVVCCAAATCPIDTGEADLIFSCRLRRSRSLFQGPRASTLPMRSSGDLLRNHAAGERSEARPICVLVVGDSATARLLPQLCGRDGRGV